jgi:hypothetical protein
LVQADTSIPIVFSSIDGQYDAIQYYDPTDYEDHWKMYDIYKPPILIDLWDVNRTMGFWIHMTEPAVLSINGKLPNTTTIDLYAGWNMVGYPAKDDTEYKVLDLKMDTGADQVEMGDPDAPYGMIVAPDDYVLKKGEGYWVKVTADCMWTINW